MEKYYAVKKGRKTGIFLNWTNCKASVNGYKGAEFKSFNTENEASTWLMRPVQTYSPNELPPVYAFTDGSYNQETNTYGYGGYLVAYNANHILHGSGKDPDMAAMRNVAGELYGAAAAINLAIRMKLPELTIFYDYAGVEKWATHEWQCNKRGTIAYQQYIDQALKYMKINFVHVKGHSGIPGNERADQLAKEAVGLY